MTDKASPNWEAALLGKTCGFCKSCQRGTQGLKRKVATSSCLLAKEASAAVVSVEGELHGPSLNHSPQPGDKIFSQERKD